MPERDVSGMGSLGSSPAWGSAGASLADRGSVAASSSSRRFRLPGGSQRRTSIPGRSSSRSLTWIGAAVAAALSLRASIAD